jgi:predicted nucleic acid-binding protein
VITYVVDASVGAKWCLPAQEEAFAKQAEELLEAYGRREIQFVVPDLFWTELGNALWRSVLKRRMSHSAADSALLTMLDLDIPVLNSGEFISDALAIAVNHGRTLYDSIYVALAKSVQSDLITADERLAKALAAYFPVKWLGAM